MKKTLVALAALASVSAYAQTTVTMDGGLDMGYQIINYKGNSVTGFNNNGTSTSQINFRGTSDLGGGMKAEVRSETDWNPASNRANTGAASVVDIGNGSGTNEHQKNSAVSSWGNGEQRVGLSGGFGRIDLGTPNFNGVTSILTGQPFGTAFGSAYGSLLGINQGHNGVRAENSIKYTSPSINGLNVAVYQSKKQTLGSNTANDFSAGLGVMDLVGSQELGVNYANGPLSVSYSSLKQDNVNLISAVTGSGSTAGTTTTGSTAATVTSFGANYAIGASKVFVLSTSNKTNTNSVNKTYQAFSVTHSIGNIVLMASLGTAKDKLDGDTSNLTAIGADYLLSKTTALYARQESIKDTAGLVAITGFTAATGNVTRTRTALGLRTTF